MYLVVDGSHLDELHSTLFDAINDLLVRYSLFSEGMPDVWYTPEVSEKTLIRSKSFRFHPRNEAWGDPDLTRTYYATITKVSKDYQLN